MCVLISQKTMREPMAAVHIISQLFIDPVAMDIAWLIVESDRSGTEADPAKAKQPNIIDFPTA